MLEQVLTYLRNWFERTCIKQDFHIVGGSLVLPFSSRQYIRIVGSTFNDGLHRYPCSDLIDEDFTGVVYGLAIPQAVLDLAEEIEKWESTNGQASRAPYTSESFGGYSYSLKSQTNTAETASGWQGAFANELNAWRKL